MKLRRYKCLLRGHDWVTVTDGPHAVTSCARCETMRRGAHGGLSPHEVGYLDTTPGAQGGRTSRSFGPGAAPPRRK